MTFEVFLALVSFALGAALTPGPNNVMLTASGVNFGIARTVPHMLGVTLGFAALVLAAGVGLGTLFVAWPQAQAVLKIAGAAYLLWLAWKIGTAGAPARDGGEGGRPMTFIQAASFQWINPKGIVAALSAIALFVDPSRVTPDLVVVLAVLTGATALSAVTWTAFGAGLSYVLRDPFKVRIFNIAMALLLVVSIIPMVLM